MQPTWLPDIRSSRCYRSIVTVIPVGLFFGATGLLVGQIPGLSIGLLVGVIIGVFNILLSVLLRSAWSWLRCLIKSLCFGLVGGLIFAGITRLIAGQFHGQDIGPT